MDWLLLAQAGNLIGCVVYYCTLAALSLPSLVLRNIGLLKSGAEEERPGSVTFYEGSVLHIRRAPVRNEFRYAVRMAVLDLDAPPTWFKSQAADHMTADEARKFASTEGPVKLLTDPLSAGYVMNPISVYYCYSRAAKGADPRLERCIAEVTNTPWGERVCFVFDPRGQSVRKALHVSPFMDMENTWHLEAPEPSDRLKLVVRASHPTHGDYFYADLVGRRAARPGARNEEAGLAAAAAFAFMPHRVAALIYWQAVKLLVKGVPFYPPPSKEYQRQLVAEQPPAASDSRQRPGSAAAQPPVTVAAAAAANGHGGGKSAGGGGGGGRLCPAAGAAAAVWGAAQHSHPRNGLDGRHFVWRQAPGWPWREG